MSEREDPLVSFHFVLEIGGVQTFFTECSGLGSETEVREYQEGTGDGSEAIRKLPGLRKYGNITFRRGITSDKSMWDWRQQVIDGDIAGARQNGSIVMYDRKRKEVARWEFQRGWPAKINVLPPQADSNEIGIEELTITHEYIERLS